MEGGQSPKKIPFSPGSEPKTDKEENSKETKLKGRKSCIAPSGKILFGAAGWSGGGGGAAGGKGVRRARTWVAQSPPAGNWVLLLAAWASRILDSRKRWEAVLVASSAPCVSWTD